MKMLVAYLYALTNAGHYELVHAIVEFALKCEGITTKLAQWFNPYKEAVEQEGATLAVALKSIITEQLRKLDAQRDGLFSTIYGGVNAMLKSLDPAKVQAAEAVMVQLESLKVNSRDNYTNQTGQLDTLLTVLLGDEKENVELLGFLPLVQELKHANDEMHRLLNERDMEQFPRMNDGMAIARKVTDAAYDDFVRSAESYTFLHAAELAENDLGFTQFFKEANARIEYVRRHNLRAPGDSEEEEEEEEEVTEEEETGGEHEGMFKATFKKGEEILAEHWYYPGDPVIEPEGLLPEGWIWGNTPSVMPNKDVTIIAVEDE